MASSSLSTSAAYAELISNIEAGGVEESQEADRRVRLANLLQQTQALQAIDKAQCAKANTGLRVTRLIGC